MIGALETTCIVSGTVVFNVLVATVNTLIDKALKEKEKKNNDCLGLGLTAPIPRVPQATLGQIKEVQEMLEKNLYVVGNPNPVRILKIPLNPNAPAKSQIQMMQGCKRKLKLNNDSEPASQETIKPPSWSEMFSQPKHSYEYSYGTIISLETWSRTEAEREWEAWLRREVYPQRHPERCGDDLYAPYTPVLVTQEWLDWKPQCETYTNVSVEVNPATSAEAISPKVFPTPGLREASAWSLEMPPDIVVRSGHGWGTKDCVGCANIGGHVRCPLLAVGSCCYFNRRGATARLQKLKETADEFSQYVANGIYRGL